jgi:choline dehydrogenase-like flavoprotein
VSASAAAEFVIVGSGVSGLLTATELVRAGREVLVLERGDFVPHEQQVAEIRHESVVPSTEHNHEAAPGTRAYPWKYLYGVGGTTLHWAGVSPRFLPSDFELRTRFGVGRDWPISYDELAPSYMAAERALGVAGGHNRLFPGTEHMPLAPHPYSPVDRLVRSPLQPYFPLPQARPTESINGRSPCCAAAHCHLCPVNARYSALHTLADAKLERSPAFELRTRMVAARLRLRARKVHEIEAFDDRGEAVTIQARTVILAANGIENPAILMRSGLDEPDLGRYLFDHEHRQVEVEIDRPSGAGRGTTLATGISYAYADGDFRSQRGSMVVYPSNEGIPMAEHLIAAVAAGRSGTDLRRDAVERYERTIAFDVLGEDLPQRERYVELSPTKDSFGLPLNRITYPTDSPYLQRSLSLLQDDLPRRLRRLGATITRIESPPGSAGAHHLGGCRMGEHDGVVNGNLRHHRISNLYVVGGSAFPAYSAHHPTLTIAALAIRLGRHLAAEAPS